MKSLSDIEPGELIRYNFGTGASILVLLNVLEDGSGVFGVFESPVFEKPMCWHAMKRDGLCLSYGSDWVIEEVHGTETIPGGYYLDQSSHLSIYEDGLVLAFLPAKGRFDFQTFLFNLTTSSVVNAVDQAKVAPISEWRLWESEAHFTNEKGPLFEMKRNDP
ncbi:hypothetical protein G6L25_04815 [Agrobacterium rhizogenes]|nr:hypothetical protein [Rhizobium rhizogenes]